MTVIGHLKHNACCLTLSLLTLSVTLVVADKVIATTTTAPVHKGRAGLAAGIVEPSLLEVRAGPMVQGLHTWVTAARRRWLSIILTRGLTLLLTQEIIRISSTAPVDEGHTGPGVHVKAPPGECSPAGTSVLLECTLVAGGGVAQGWCCVVHWLDIARAHSQAGQPRVKPVLVAFTATIRECFAHVCQVVIIPLGGGGSAGTTVLVQDAVPRQLGTCGNIQSTATQASSTEA